MDTDQGSVGLKIDTLKPMHLETVLAADGDASAKIVIGDHPAHERQAERIAEVIEAATGARLPVVRAGDVPASRGLLDTHVVAFWGICPTTPSFAGCITSGGPSKTSAIPARGVIRSGRSTTFWETGGMWSFWAPATRTGWTSRRPGFFPGSVTAGHCVWGG